MGLKDAKNTVSAGAVFLRKNWQVIYAGVLIILVPLAIVMNTFFIVNRFRKTVDVELQRTALIIGKMIEVTSQDAFADRELLQQRLVEIAATLPEVRSLDILEKIDEDFAVAASLYEDGIGREAHGTQNILSWYDDQAIAYLTKSPRSAGMDQKLTPQEIRSDERFWGVVMPLHDLDGEKLFLLNAKISLSIIDALVRENLFWSYVWLSITVLIVILILASNTRLFEFAILFRKLQEVDKMKDDFIGMASHELRAPITAVRGYLSLFLEDAFGKLDEKAHEVMTTTFQITTHLGSLVEDLLDVSRIQQGRLEFDYEIVDVGPLIDLVITQMKFEAEKKDLAYSYQRPESPPPKIRVDVKRLSQVLLNLSSNAIKYTPSGSVTITSVMKDDKLEIKVTDTGLGMSAEQRENLFQKFYRVKTAETSLIVGTGLGLWITKKIVEAMKGKIFVDSIVGVGSQFSVLLPVVKEEEGSGESSPSTSEKEDVKKTEEATGQEVPKEQVEKDEEKPSSDGQKGNEEA